MAKFTRALELIDEIDEEEDDPLDDPKWAHVLSLIGEAPEGARSRAKRRQQLGEMRIPEQAPEQPPAQPPGQQPPVFPGPVQQQPQVPQGAQQLESGQTPQQAGQDMLGGLLQNPAIQKLVFEAMGETPLGVQLGAAGADPTPRPPGKTPEGQLPTTAFPEIDLGLGGVMGRTAGKTTSMLGNAMQFFAAIGQPQTRMQEEMIQDPRPEAAPGQTVGTGEYIRVENDPRISPMYRVGEQWGPVGQELVERYSGDPEKLGFMVKVIDNPWAAIGGGMAENAAPLIAVVGASLAGGAPGGIATGFFLEGGEAYSAALREGASQQQATEAGMIAGTINSVLEYIPVARAIDISRLTKLQKKKMIGVLGKLGSVATQAGAEGVTEFTQELAQEFAGYVAWGEAQGMELKDLLSEDKIEGYLEAGLTGAGLGTGTGIFALAAQMGQQEMPSSETQLTGPPRPPAGPSERPGIEEDVPIDVPWEVAQAQKQLLPMTPMEEIDTLPQLPPAPGLLPLPVHGPKDRPPRNILDTLQPEPAPFLRGEEGRQVPIQEEATRTLEELSAEGGVLRNLGVAAGPPWDQRLDQALSESLELKAEAESRTGVEELEAQREARQIEAQREVTARPLTVPPPKKAATRPPEPTALVPRDQPRKTADEIRENLEQIVVDAESVIADYASRGAQRTAGARDAKDMLEIAQNQLERLGEAEPTVAPVKEPEVEEVTEEGEVEGGIDTREAPTDWMRKGPKQTMQTNKLGPQETTWVVAEAAELIPSNDPHTLNKNENYPQELQGRDREKIATEELVSDIARNPNPDELLPGDRGGYGAPVIDESGQVIDGNGRVMGIWRGYDNDTADVYRAAVVAKAEELGIDIEGISEPVLVQFVEGQSPQEKVALAEDANAPAVTEMSAVEKAQQDAKKITAGDLDLYAGGDLTSAANRPFVSAMMNRVPKAQRAALMDSKGVLSAEGVRRFQGSLLAAAYPENSDVLERLLESTDNNIKSVGQALLAAAADTAKINTEIAAGELYDQSVSDAVTEAAAKLAELRDKEQNVPTYLAQKNLLGDELSPEARRILELFDKWKRKPKNITQLLLGYNEALRAHPRKQMGLMGGANEPTRSVLLKSAMKKVGGPLETPQATLELAPEPQPEAADVDAEFQKLADETGKAKQKGKGVLSLKARETLKGLREQGLKVPKKAKEKLDEALGDVQKDVKARRAKLKKKRGDKRPGELGAAALGGVQPQTRTKEGPEYRETRFTPAAEEALRQGREIPSNSFIDLALKAKAALTQAIRERKFLPRNVPLLVPAREVFRRMGGVNDFAGDVVARKMKKILGPLSPEEHNLFVDKMAVDSARSVLQWNRDNPLSQPMALPSSLTAQDLTGKKADEFDAEVAADEAVTNAVKEMRDFWAETRDDLADALRGQGMKQKADDLYRFGDRYMHHAYIQTEQQMQAEIRLGAAVLSKPSKGWLKQRKSQRSQVLDLHYGDVQGRVLQDMLATTENVKLLGEMNSKYNEKPRLVRKANKRIMAILDSEQKGMRQRFRESITKDKRARGDKIRERAGKVLFNKTDNTKLASEMKDWRRIRRAELARKHNWRNLAIEEGLLTETGQGTHSVWSPEPGQLFATAWSIPEAKATEALISGLSQISDMDVRQTVMLAAGEVWLLPTEVTNQLLEQVNIQDRIRKRGIPMKLMVGYNRYWKGWQLFNPKRWARYLTRNVISDNLTKGLAYNPAAATKFKTAISDLVTYMGGGEATEDLHQFLLLGGARAGLWSQEFSDSEKLKLFSASDSEKALLEAHILLAIKNPAKALAGVGTGWFRKTRQLAFFLETMGRYAQYLSYLENLRNNQGVPSMGYGGSLRAEINAIPDYETRAYWLSNELLGAYDMVSVAGQAARETMVPFWSFHESNMRTYSRVIRNIGVELLEDIAAKEGFKETVKRNVPYMAYAGGRLSATTMGMAARFALMAGGLRTLTQVVNDHFFPDEEEDLPKDIQESVHFIGGRDAHGDVQYFNRLGTFQEALNLQPINGEILGDMVNGRISPGKALGESTRLWMDSTWNLVGPMLKTPMEIIGRRTTFPSVTRQRELDNYWHALTNQLGMNLEYQALADHFIPGEEGQGRIERYLRKATKDMFIYTQNADRAAYYDTQANVQAWLTSKGEKRQSFASNPASRTLREMREAVIYGDKPAAQHYLVKYIDMLKTSDETITDKQIFARAKASMRNNHPLNAVKKAKRDEFRAWLTPEERRRSDQAVEYYETMLKDLVDLEPRLVPSFTSGRTIIQLRPED